MYDDEDDFSIVVRANPGVAPAADAAAVTAEPAPKAQVASVEGFIFDRTMYSHMGGERRKAPPREPQGAAAAGAAEDVGRAESGPWAPMPKVEEIRLVSAKTAAVPPAAEPGAAPAVAVRAAPAAAARQKPASKVTTTYLGAQPVDYQNRRFCDARRMPGAIAYSDSADEASSDEEEAIVPEAAKMLGLRKKGRQGKKRDVVPTRLVRDYGACAMGLQRVRAWGGLALTAGLDGACVVWDASKPGDVMGATQSDMANDMGMIQSYVGHGGDAVKDCWFASDGQRFASAGFDGCVVLWDTDTGRELSRYRGTSGSMNAVRFRPQDDNVLLAACGDRKLRHWDVRQAVDKPAQTYDYHQSSNVNACSFCDMGRRFVSTGDDKKILVWDLAVPAPIKIFSETWLPGMPALATHPGSFTVAALGMDSKIANFRVSKKSGKILRSGDVTAEGFKAAGFACEPCFSPDGEFLACGDGDEGGVWIWRLKRKRGDQGGLVQRLAGAHAPGTPVSSVMWHPAFEGVLLSVGWDGRLKWWGM